MTEIEPQVTVEQPTVLLVFNGRQQRVEMSPVIGGLSKAIDAWSEAKHVHRGFHAGGVDTHELDFGPWVLAERYGRVVEDPVA